MSSEDTAGVHSYDAGQKPYSHDPKREKWEKPWDFYSACFANSFGMRTFYIFSLYMQATGGAFIILPIVCSVILYIIPVFFVQSFLGQFSGTGFISVFRISPLFKGIGYLILILNVISAIYNSTMASYTLLYFLMSFQLNTTWMYCDNSWNTPSCMDASIFPEDENTTESLMPSYEYFYHGVLRISHDIDAVNVSWPVILGQLVIWIITGYILSGGIVKIGRFLRYTTLISATISVIIFIRVCCLPEAGTDSAMFFSWNGNSRITPLFPWIVGPMISSTMLGRGWGIVLTLSSFQPFRSNLERHSFVIPLALTAFAASTGFMLSMIEGFVARRSEISIKFFDQEGMEYLFIAIPYFVGKLEASQMWSMLFFFMFFSSELALIIIQAFVVVTSVADEFSIIRTWKYEFLMAFCLINFLISIFFTIEHLADAIPSLISSNYLSQNLICFLEIMIVVWIYGRERFLRDIRFMRSTSLAQWKFYILRFITPVLIILAGFVFAVTAIFHLLDSTSHIRLFVGFIKGLPWVFIPGYAIVKLVTTIGTIPERVKRCIRPNDWFPADPVEKERYNAALGFSDISQQLLEMNENDVL